MASEIVVKTEPIERPSDYDDDNLTGGPSFVVTNVKDVFLGVVKEEPPEAATSIPTENQDLLNVVADATPLGAPSSNIKGNITKCTNKKTVQMLSL